MKKYPKGRLNNVGCSGMTKKPKYVRWWLFAAVTFLMCIVLQIPAAWLMAKFYQNNQILHNMSGNIWSGQADWTRGQLRGSVSWKVRPLDVLRLRLGAHVEIHSGRSHIEGVVGYGLGKTLTLHDIDGQIAAETLQYVANWQWPSNAIQLQQIALVYKPEQGFSRADGQMQWAGGELIYQYAQQQDRMNIPALKAQLSDREGQLVLDVRDQREQKMLNIAIDPKLMLDLQLTQRLLLNTASYQGKAGLDTYVLSTRQPLWQGGR